MHSTDCRSIPLPSAPPGKCHISHPLPSRRQSSREPLGPPYGIMQTMTIKQDAQLISLPQNVICHLPQRPATYIHHTKIHVCALPILSSMPAGHAATSDAARPDLPPTSEHDGPLSCPGCELEPACFSLSWLPVASLCGYEQMPAVSPSP